MKLFVLDPDPNQRRRIVASLEALSDVDRVADAGTLHEARDTLGDSDLVVLDAAVLADLLRKLPNGSAPRLTGREQRVLALIADGHPTREVARRLSYSERTVKNVLHDVVTKLNARSRSQAVAFAVREGLI